MGLVLALRNWLEHMPRTLHTKPYADFLEVLTAARREKGLTQQQVANRLGKPQSYVAKIEGGERRLDVVEFIDICRAMDVDPEHMFGNILQAIEHNE